MMLGCAGSSGALGEAWADEASLRFDEGRVALLA